LKKTIEAIIWQPMTVATPFIPVTLHASQVFGCH